MAKTAADILVEQPIAWDVREIFVSSPYIRRPHHFLSTRTQVTYWRVAPAVAKQYL